MQAVILDENEEVLEVIALQAKTFKGTSGGFFGSGKMPMDGKSCQGSMILVEIGSE